MGVTGDGRGVSVTGGGRVDESVAAASVAVPVGNVLLKEPALHPTLKSRIRRGVKTNLADTV
jgi:hypothetical protein